MAHKKISISMSDEEDEFFRDDYKKKPMQDGPQRFSYAFPFSKRNSFGECPPGLEPLYDTPAAFVRPYSGPNVVGHFSKDSCYEVLNTEGRRLFLVSNSYTTRSAMKLAREAADGSKVYPVYMSVINYAEKEVFQFYGKPGKFIKTGPRGQPSWGFVNRVWRNFLHMTLSNYSRYNVFIEKINTNTTPTGSTEIKLRTRRLSRQYSGVVTRNSDPAYVIEGIKTKSLCPSASTRKLYYGTFIHGIFPGLGYLNVTLNEKLKDGVDYQKPLGKICSTLPCPRLGYDFPGIEFHRGMDVHHKAVILGMLFIDIIRHHHL